MDIGDHIVYHTLMNHNHIWSTTKRAIVVAKDTNTKVHRYDIIDKDTLENKSLVINTEIGTWRLEYKDNFLRCEFFVEKNNYEI